MTRDRRGFTIVELLIVIVVIGILAAITIVAFNGISQRALESTLRSDLAGAKKTLMAYYAVSDTYPTANNCTAPSTTEVCLKASPGTTYNYVPNNSTVPPRFQLAATNGATSFAVTESSSPQSSYGSQFVMLTNMAQNSDFGGGGTNWTNYCVAPSQCVFSNGTAVLTADPAGRAWFRQNIAGSYTDGDKIFYSARIRKDSGSDMRTLASRTNGGYDTNIMTPAAFNASPTGTYVRHSGIRTYVASQGVSSDFHFGDVSAGEVFQATIDDVVVINLTANFGTGNEPSVTVMNDILSQFENGWFSGTTNATY